MGTTRVAGVLAAVALIVCGSAGALVPPSTARLDPAAFADLSTGVVLIRGFTCDGVPKITGTGFLVGRSVVMTARHVVDPGGAEAKYACRVKVRVDGRWMAAKPAWWHGAADPTGRQTDLATLKLARAAGIDDHIFEFRNSSARVGSNLSVIGYPLGHPVGLSQGKLVGKGHLPHGTVPLLEINLLSGQGASGSPIVSDGGYVVGVLQDELDVGSGTDLFTGNHISTDIYGIDVPSWWGSGNKAERRLCQVYPHGGIPGCGGVGNGSGEATEQTPPAGAPPPPPWLPPSGFAFWDGAGTYAAATVAYRYAASSCTPATYSVGCWGVIVVTHDGCNGGLFVKVNFLDSSQNIIDTGIDSVPAAAPDSSLLTQGSIFTQGVSQFAISEIDCFNF